MPIVMLFTDDPMTTVRPATAPTTPATTPSTTAARSPTAGYVRYTPVQAEAFATAYNLGDVRNQFIITGGNTSLHGG